MDRLTVETNLLFCDIALCSSEPGGLYCPDKYCDQRRIYERLREYERTGLMPNEIPTAAEMAAFRAAIKEQVKALEAKLPQADDLENCISLAQERRSKYEQQMDDYEITLDRMSPAELVKHIRKRREERA